MSETSGWPAERMPVGYQRTEAGVIPDAWRVDNLRQCLSGSPTYGINSAAVPFADGLLPYLRITDIGQDHRFRPSPRVAVSHPNARDYLMREGDIVVARTGASVGKSYCYSSEDGPLVFAGFLIRLRADPAVLDPVFLSYYLQSARYWKWVEANSIRSGQPGINGQEYGALKVPLPTVAEQRAIAGVVSDVDRLLDSLDALIAKKRDIKAAVTQQLLTGAVRLPGFSGEWATKSLSEIGTFSRGGSLRRDQLSQIGSPCVLYGEIYTRYSDYTARFTSRVHPNIAEGALPVRTGDIMFAASGETAEEIGRCVSYTGEGTAYAGGDIIVFTPSGQNSVYLGCLLNSPAIALQKARMAQGHAVVHIGVRALAQISLVLPELDEQDAIAPVIMDLDAEIEALEQRRGKTRALKQGMMQQLLTGRTRLAESPGTGGAKAL